MSVTARWHSTAAPASIAGVDAERFTVASGSLVARLQAWSEVVAASMTALEMHPTARTPADFRGALKRQRFGALALVDCATSPSVGHRSQWLVDHGEAFMGLQFVQRGAERARDRHREAVIAAGDVVLWDGRRAVDVEVLEPVYKRVVLVPLELMSSVCPRLADQTALPSLRGSATARLLVRYVNALAVELPDLDEAARAAAASATVDLLRATIEPLLPSNRTTVRAAMREEIRRYVRVHLQDPELRPETIARAYSMSVRSLHALFDDVDESVAGLVRTERLVHCLQDLQRAGTGTVSEIALRWGFRDPAHFSRVFKRAYGETPRAVRQAACVGRPGGP